MKDLLKTLEGFSLIVKILLTFLYSIPNHIYRIVRALDENNTKALIIGIVVIFVPVWFIVDLVYVIVTGNYLYIG